MKIYKTEIFVVLICLVMSVLFISINSKKKTSRLKYSKSIFQRLNSQRYKNVLQSLLSARNPRQDDTLPDPEVVYSMTLASHNKKEASCPYPYVLAESNCEDYSCDLNDGKGGNYVYLCIAKKKISKLSLEENMVNKIVINLNNDECGSLNSIQSTLKKSRITSNEITLCYGYEEKIRPFKDIKVFLKKNSEDIVPINCKIEIVKHKYLCTDYEGKAPLKIEYSDLNLLTKEDNFKILGKPEAVAEIENDNGAGKTDNSVKRTISVLKVKTASWNIENKLGFKVDTKFSSQVPVIGAFKVSAAASFEFNTSMNKGEITTEQEIEQIDYSCNAPPGKFYKCIATNNKIQADIPYTINRTVYYYDGKKETKQINSVFNGVMTSSLRFERCCYRYCTNNDKLCQNWDKDSKNNSVVCPKLQDAETVDPNPTEEKKVTLDPIIDTMVITDIQVVEGKSTTCTDGYVFVESFNKKNSKKTNDGKLKFDTNKGSKDQIFVCVQKTNLSKIEKKPINAIRLNKRNSDCGLLNSAKTIINEKHELMICYGYDALTSLSPISDMIFADKDEIPELQEKDYICDLGIFKGDFTLCYIRNTNAPQTVQLRNYQYDYAGMRKYQMGPPKKVNEIIVASTSASMQVKSVKRVETTEKTVYDFGGSISFGLTAKFLVVENTNTASASYKNTNSKEKKEANEKSEATTFECAAAEPKTIKCVASMFQYKNILPYTAEMIHLDYDGKEIVNFNKKISGTKEDIASSGLSISSCCLENCCEGNETKESNKPWCLKDDKPLPRDRLCDELEVCFNQIPKKFRKGNKKRRY